MIQHSPSVRAGDGNDLKDGPKPRHSSATRRTSSHTPTHRPQLDIVPVAAKVPGRSRWHDPGVPGLISRRLGGGYHYANNIAGFRRPSARSNKQTAQLALSGSTSRGVRCTCDIWLPPCSPGGGFSLPSDKQRISAEYQRVSRNPLSESGPPPPGVAAPSPTGTTQSRHSHCML